MNFLSEIGMFGPGPQERAQIKNANFKSYKTSDPNEIAKIKFERSKNVQQARDIRARAEAAEALQEKISKDKYNDRNEYVNEHLNVHGHFMGSTSNNKKSIDQNGQVIWTMPNGKRHYPYYLVKDDEGNKFYTQGNRTYANQFKTNDEWGDNRGGRRSKKSIKLRRSRRSKKSRKARI